jgi:hypothetical protein
VETRGSPFHPACISVTDMRVEDVRTPRVSDVFVNREMGVMVPVCGVETTPGALLSPSGFGSLDDPSSLQW